MVQRIGAYLTKVSCKYMPDPFIFAILLSILVFIGGITLANQTPFQTILHWKGGFWNLLTFAMQMSLIIVLGFAVASSQIVNRWLQMLANAAKKLPPGCVYGCANRHHRRDDQLGIRSRAWRSLCQGDGKIRLPPWGKNALSLTRRRSLPGPVGLVCRLVRFSAAPGGHPRPCYGSVNRYHSDFQNTV